MPVLCTARVMKACIRWKTSARVFSKSTKRELGCSSTKVFNCSLNFTLIGVIWRSEPLDERKNSNFIVKHTHKVTACTNTMATLKTEQNTIKTRSNDIVTPQNSYVSTLSLIGPTIAVINAVRNCTNTLSTSAAYTHCFTVYCYGRHSEYHTAYGT